jgi:hypothetical protein
LEQIGAAIMAAPNPVGRSFESHLPPSLVHEIASRKNAH